MMIKPKSEEAVRVYQILGVCSLFVLIIFLALMYRYFNPVLTDIDYSLSISIPAGSSSSTSSVPIALYSYPVFFRSADVVEIHSPKDNAEIWLNKDLKAANLRLDTSASKGSDPYNPNPADVEIVVNGKKFSGNDFNLELSSVHGDNQSYEINLSWKGRYKVVRKMIVHWVSLTELQKIGDELEKNRKV